MTDKTPPMSAAPASYIPTNGTLDHQTSFSGPRRAGILKLKPLHERGDSAPLTALQLMRTPLVSPKAVHYFVPQDSPQTTASTESGSPSQIHVSAHSPQSPSGVRIVTEARLSPQAFAQLQAITAPNGQPPALQVQQDGTDQPPAGVQSPASRVDIAQAEQMVQGDTDGQEQAPPPPPQGGGQTQTLSQPLTTQGGGQVQTLSHPLPAADSGDAPVPMTPPHPLPRGSVVLQVVDDPIPVTRPQSWADSKGATAIIVEELESAGKPGVVVGAAIRFTSSTVKVPFQVAGAPLHASAGIVLGTCAVFAAIPGCCHDRSRQVAIGLASEALDQGKAFVVTVISPVGTIVTGVPSYFISCCSPEVIKRIERSVFSKLESFCLSKEVRGPAPHSESIEVQLAIKKSLPMRCLNWMTDAPHLQIKKPSLPETHSEASRDVIYEKIIDCETASCPSGWPAIGALFRLIRKGTNYGLMSAGSAASTGATAFLGTIALPFKLVGCCSESSNRVAKGLNKAAKTTGKMAFVTTGRILASPIAAIQYIFGCCARRNPDTGVNAVDECCETNCDKPVYKCLASCCLPKRVPRYNHLNAPVPAEERISKAVTDSAPMDVVKWMCDMESFNYQTHRVTTHRTAASLGNGLRG